MLFELFIQLVGQCVDRRVHIGMFRVGDHFIAGNMQRGFDFLLQFFDGHRDLHISDLVEMSLQSFEFFADVGAKRFGHFQLVSTDVDLHTASPSLPVHKAVDQMIYHWNAVAWPYINRLRSLEGAIPRDSRYLATVRRAT
ncbi:hypothetical protein D3C73_1308720 [compost metagenome]